MQGEYLGFLFAPGVTLEMQWRSTVERWKSAGRLLADARLPHSILEREFGKTAHTIQMTEKRGLRPHLLEKIVKFADTHWQAWTDIGDPVYSKTAGDPWDIASLNLYQLNDWVIKPATEPHQCSLVELMCEPGTTEQTPTWFVSHCWCAPRLGLSSLSCSVASSFLGGCYLYCPACSQE